jgi:hypothetical protein
MAEAILGSIIMMGRVDVWMLENLEKSNFHGNFMIRVSELVFKCPT